MKNSEIKAIIFDLGNVLLDFDHRIAAERISKFCDKTGREIFDLFFDSPLTGLFEEGKISPRRFFLKVKEMLDLRMDYDKFVPIWNDIFFLSDENRAVYNLARPLKEHYRLAVLSNVNTLHFEYVKKEFPVFDAFHSIIASCDLGLRKPDPLIYRKTLDMLRVSPGEVFYTDDRAELIQSASSLGIHGFVFNGIEQLKNDLAAEGINHVRNITE